MSGHKIAEFFVNKTGSLLSSADDANFLESNIFNDELLFTLCEACFITS